MKICLYLGIILKLASCGGVETKDEMNIVHEEITVEAATEDIIESYIIEDADGYSNLREEPGGKVIRKVYTGEKFEIVGDKINIKK